MGVDAREAIALLAPGTIDPTKTYVLGGTSITPQDIAASMATLCEIANYLLLVKYAGDVSSLKPLTRAWFKVLCAKWREAAADMPKIREIAEDSIFEAVSPNRCRSCNGVGEQQVGSSVLVCSACGGSGYWYQSPPLSKPWDKRFQWCSSTLARMESKALSQVKARLV